MIGKVATEAPDTAVRRSTRSLAIALGLVGVAAVVVGVLLAALPVHVPRAGDSSPYRCTPFRSAFAGAPMGLDCAPHVQGRLAEATLAEVTGGIMLGVGLVVALAAGRP